MFTFPTNDGLTMTALGLPHSELHTFRSNIEGNFRSALHMMTDLRARSEQARREERFYTMADVPNFFRKPYGAGWALVGDAGHHKDPTLAFGISDAFCDAELLAEAIHQGFSGAQPLEAALTEYEQSRNARAMPDHEENYRMAHLEGWDAPEILALRAALRGNEADTAHFCMVRARAVPPETFFAPENIQRIMRQANQRPETIH
jgi:flavin-dependent dehydrogenase